MKPGESVVVDIHSLTSKGDGLAVCDGREVVIPRGVPGDRAEVFLRRKHKGRFEAVIDDLIESGVPRRDPPCVHFGHCGGCRWQDIDTDDQLRMKEGLVRAAFDERGLAPQTWLPIVASPDTFYYRNKMEFSFGTDREGGLQLGLHQRGRFNRVFDLEACHLQSEASNEIVDAFRRHATRMAVPVYDLKTHEGVLRFLVVRDAKGTGQTLANLVVGRYPDDAVDALLAAALDELGPRLTACVVTLHTGKAQVAAGEAEFVVKGSGRIWESCGGLEFVVSPQSFFQTNTRAAAGLYRRIVELAGNLRDADVLDLYAGTGGISLHLARTARSVVGIEQVRDAVEDARRNAEHNGVGNCAFVADRAENALQELRSADGEGFGVIVADPPRVGIHPKALESMLRLGAPTVVYVSCNPQTLADDLVSLHAGGYDIRTVLPVEMFPHTPHCEVVAQLARSPRWRRPEVD